MATVTRMPVVAGILVFSLAGAAAAQAPAPTPTNDDCLACHGDKDMAVRADGRTSVLVDAPTYAASVHGQIQANCVDCHVDLAKPETEHPGKAAPVDCATCHAEAVTEYAASVHGKARSGGRTLAATCVSCHGIHDIRAAKDPESRTYHLNLPRTCGTCHGNDTTIQQAHLHGGNILDQFEDSIHGRALTKGGLLVAPSCGSCHGAHDIQAHGDPKSRVSRARVPDTCGGCHEGVKLKFARGKHGEQLQQDNPRAPVCIDCHESHSIQRAELTTWQVDVIRECGTCHAESIETYRDTFHGQVTALGFTRVATCASCHGAHEVLPKADPASPVNPARVVATCQQCHPGANENFAQYHPHANKHDRERHRALYYTATFMDLLLLGVFSFFGIHTGLWFTKEWRVKRARRKVAASPETPGPSGGAA